MVTVFKIVKLSQSNRYLIKKNITLQKYKILNRLDNSSEKEKSLLKRLQIANENQQRKELNLAETIETTSTPVSGKTVILDAGHGSPDEGVILLGK